MNMRPKTVKRLMALISGFLLLVVLSVAFVFYRWHQIDQRMQATRAQGMASYERGDYPAVLKQLGGYLGVPKNQTDAEALFAYAKSRSRVEESDHHEIGESVDLFQRYLALKPDDLEAQRLLLDLLPQVGKNAEARDLADSILAKHPDDPQALRAKATALLRLRQYKNALAVAQKLNKVAPKDLEGQMITLQTMSQLDEPIDQLLKRTAELRAANPGDPRFELLEGWVHAWRSVLIPRSNADEVKASLEQAKTWVLKAAAHPVKDADFVKMLAGQMDRLGLYADVRKLLETATADNNDPKLRKLLVDRLFQNGQYQQIVDQLKDLDPASQMSGSELLAMKALALFSLNQRDEANKIVEALSKRTRDEVALGWATALRTRYEQTNQDAQAMVVQYQSALVRNPQSAIIRYYLGELYAKLGEDNLALQQWGRAMQAAPGWFLPHLMASKVLLNSGQATEAAQQARVAYQIMPRNIQVMSNLLVIRFIQQDPSDAASNAQQLKEIEQFQKLLPGEPQTLPVYVALLARTGKVSQAADVLNKALAGESKDKPYSEETLLRLASISHQYHLGLEQTLFDHSLKIHGLTPALASAQAEALARAGKVKEGLALLREDATKAGNAVDWRIAVARYLEATADPAARDAWMALGEDQANNKNLSLQLLILDAPSLWSVSDENDTQPQPNSEAVRAFLQRTIDRVHTLTSDEAMAWKLGEARWLLGSKDKDKDSARAVVILADLLRAAPRLTKARKLMALANENIGQTASAVEQLKQALQSSPKSVDIQLDLGRLLQAQGKPDEARGYLVAAAEGETASTAVKYRAASMLARQGEDQAAISILEKLPSTHGRDLMLGELYARRGRVSDAAKLYGGMNLLADKTPDAGLLLAVAEFYADQGQTDLAKKYLARLSDAKIKPDVRALMIAGFQERHGTPAEALAAFTAATQAAPDSSAAWVGLAGYDLRSGRLDQAIAAADQGSKSVADPADLSALKSLADDLKSMDNPAAFRPLIVALSRQPRHEVAQQAWQILRHGVQQKLPADKTLDALKQLADKNPRFLPLQSILVTQYAALGKAAEAQDAVAKLTDLFPSSPEVAEQAVRIYAASGNWRSMLSAAQKWRQRVPGNPLHPDLAIAEAQCFLGNPSAALEQLSPYIAAAQKDPQHHANVLVGYTRALTLAGRTDDAAKILTPLLPTSPAWRAHWLSLASAGRRSVQSASQWIETAAQYIKPDNHQERVLLAKTWYDVAQASGDKALHQKAIDILTDLAKQPNVKPEVLVMLGSSAEQMGKVDLAMDSYRRALKDQPIPFAQNELAYLLVTQGGDAHQAKDLALKAVAASPGTAAYHDTLGHAYLKLGDRANAILSFEKATNLDPRNVDTLLALGDALLDDGKADKAAAIADQLGKLAPATLKDSQSKQLETLLKRLRQSASQAKGT